MLKITLFVIALIFFTANAGRPGYPEQVDFSKCLTALSDLQPNFADLVDKFGTGDKNQYIQGLKNLVGEFRSAALHCGIDVPESNVVGDPAKCDQDIVLISAIIKELMEQSVKPQKDQNIFSVISAGMGLGSNLPRAAKDCAPSN